MHECLLHKMVEKEVVGWVEFCFATQNKMQPIKEAKKKQIKKEIFTFFDGLQGAFALEKTPFHPSYTSGSMLLSFMQLPCKNPKALKRRPANKLKCALFAIDADKYRPKSGGF